MAETDAYSQYRETQIMTASQGKLVVLLYEGAIRFIDAATTGLDNKKYDVVNTNLLRAQDILTELAIARADKVRAETSLLIVPFGEPRSRQPQPCELSDAYMYNNFNNTLRDNPDTAERSRILAALKPFNKRR